MKKLNVAVVGCGNISSIYLENLTGRFQNVTVYAVSDLVAEKAKAQAEKYGVERIMSFDEILMDPNVDIVLNITTPQTHYSLCKAALLAGKHVYSEKPLATDLDKAKAAMRGKRVVFTLTLESGDAEATAWGCDLTEEYVEINGKYTT